MSKAKWFAVRKPSTGEIIATSANQIVPPKFRGPTNILYYIQQTPFSSCSVEGGSGAETRPNKETIVWRAQLLFLILSTFVMKWTRLLLSMLNWQIQVSHPLLKIVSFSVRAWHRWPLSTPGTDPKFSHRYQMVSSCVQSPPSCWHAMSIRIQNGTRPTYINTCRSGATIHLRHIACAMEYSLY